MKDCRSMASKISRTRPLAARRIPKRNLNPKLNPSNLDTMHNTVFKNTSRCRILLGFGRLLLCAMLVGGGASLLAQEPAAPAGEGAHAGPKTWVDKFKQGGWVMYPIIGLS